MINKKLELVNEIDLYISPTINGIGVTITPENDEASFSEYLWICKEFAVICNKGH